MAKDVKSGQHFEVMLMEGDIFDSKMMMGNECYFCNLQ